eukprot:3910878-Rhodomonas_salina.1
MPLTCYLDPEITKSKTRNPSFQYPPKSTTRSRRPGTNCTGKMGSCTACCHLRAVMASFAVNHAHLVIKDKKPEIKDKKQPSWCKLYWKEGFLSLMWGVAIMASCAVHDAYLIL